MNRVRKLRLEMGWSQEELGAKIGVQKAAICKYEREKVKLPENVILAFCNLFGVTADYLLCREEVTPFFKPDKSWNAAPIPLIGMVHAGLPMFSEEFIREYIPAPNDVALSGDCFYMEVVGDCMTGDHIPEGALVLVRKQPVLDNNAIGVVRVAGEVLLRHVKMLEKKIVLVASNPKYEPMIVSEGNVAIVGKVIEVHIRC